MNGWNPLGRFTPNRRARPTALTDDQIFALFLKGESETRLSTKNIADWFQPTPQKKSIKKRIGIRT